MGHLSPTGRTPRESVGSYFSAETFSHVAFIRRAWSSSQMGVCIGMALCWALQVTPYPQGPHVDSNKPLPTPCLHLHERGPAWLL